jgi:SAM-dependent methyltransferase
MSRPYWDKNIRNWSNLYLKISHTGETFACPKFLEALYHLTLTPIEARLMRQRYRKTMEFIESQAREGVVFGDLGCGSGIFAVEILRRGASVVCVDYSASSLTMARESIERHCPEHLSRASFAQLDLVETPIPRCDVAMALGVAPYVADIESFFGNILPHTRQFYCLMIDPGHIYNRVRQRIPVLNVRKLHFHARERIDRIYLKHGWDLRRREDFASGYLDWATAPSTAR